MEFLLIGESKIKIVLDTEETKKYKLDSASCDGGSAGFRRSFWKVLDLAKAEVGFDPAGDKVLIQLYPIKNGGLELFVTKLGVLPESSRRIVSRSDKISLLSRRRSLYSFDCLEDLTAASRAIKAFSGEIIPVSDVYESEGRYYLSIEEYGKGGEQIEFHCIMEFGNKLTAELSAYITEHARRLAKGNAVDIFSAI